MNRARSGFTIIELMLAMTFISMLLLAVAMTTIQVSNIYTKGITLRQLNQVGRSITTQLQQDVSNSEPFDIGGAASKYVARDGGGRLCLGQYSYVWNYGTALAGGQGAPLIANKYDDQTNIRFARVSDPGGALCIAPASSSVQKSQAAELLAGGDRNLAVQAFSISQASASTPGQALYTIKLTIGTNDQQQLNTNNASCKPPTEGDGMEMYCAINEFTIVAQAGNQAEGGQ